MTSHDEWDELAAGYALHVLEPDEELLFTDHLSACEECAVLLRDHELVAAQLGSLAFVDDDAAAPAWASVRAAVVGTAPPVSLDEHRRNRRRQPWFLGAAAAAVVVAGAAIVLSHSSGSSASPADRAIDSCRHQPNCSIIRLHASQGADPGVVLVSGDRATMVPLAMPAPPTGEEYVLWQLPRSGAPKPVTEFTDASAPNAAGLVISYADTAAFAVSVEPAAVPPSQPTRVIASGSTPA
jgi:hypothetical protein